MRTRPLLILTLCFLALLSACTSPTQPAASSQAEPTATQSPAPTATPPAANTPAPTEAPAEPTDEPLVASNNAAADADVEFVRVQATGSDTFTFHVTVAHPDTGWDDYADGWDVVLPDGTVVTKNQGDTFTRLLAHPHETEQPFTRSQSGVVIPTGITMVTVRAHDIVDGFGGHEVVVDLTMAEGDRYSVEQQ